MNAVAKNHCRSFVLLLLLFCCKEKTFAQPAANFTSSGTAGCAPLIINFTDASSGNPTQWKWDLGNGVTSLLKNPSATYFNPGTYSIKLVVRNAAGSDSITRTNYITVYEPPTALFSADKTTGCFPLRVQFSDSSTAGSGNLLQWFWDFGDGNTSTQQNPAHTYTTAGNYSTTLKVTNSKGCVKILTRLQYITVANGVSTSFNHIAPGVCPPPSGVQFTNASTGPGPLSYQWNFGDGSTSTATDPFHTYLTTGNYSVSLVVTSPQGCVDSITKADLIRLNTVAASFSSADSVCTNQPILFSNSSTPAPVSITWNFGNGTTSTQETNSVVYTTPGTYTVTLIANFGGCFDTVSKQLTVFANPLPSFDASPKLFCSLPAVVNFSNAPVAGGTLLWDFGDGTTSTQNNPAHTYTTEGTYTVTLTATNAASCSQALVKNDLIRIQRPAISINNLPRTGCLPLTINPTATVLSAHNISSYLWKFGDGTTSASVAPSHTYTAAGTYTVTLVYTTDDGCTDSVVISNAVRTGSKPRAGFSLTPRNACAYQTIQFQDSSSTPIDQWFWSFGDGGTSTVENPVYNYSDTGWFHVQLVVFNNTCPDTIRWLNAVHIKPPIAQFLVGNNCNAPYTKQFTDRSIGAQTWTWNFGDGSTSTGQNPVHTYAAAGTYSVTLTVTNDTCQHTTQRIVRVIDEKAVFTTPDPVLCRNGTAAFISSGINKNNITSWSWNFGDGTSATTDSVAIHTYTTSGNYRVLLTITDLLGCTDTASLPITIHGPTANFVASAGIVCLSNNKVTFTDLSTTDGQHPLIKRVWNYGDGTIDSTGAAPYQHSYSTTGSYTISLRVTDSFGCTDSLVKQSAVVIAQPEADFSSLDTVSCVGKSIAFTNLSTAQLPQWQWSFGDGTTSGLNNPVHSYTATGVYSITLVVTDGNGCKDTLTKPDYINISFPKASFTVSDSAGTCPPLLVNFYNASSDYKSLIWNFGDGNTSLLDSPAHYYTAPGIYYATLTVTGPGGCTSIDSQKIEIKGPTGSFTYAPLSGCKPLAVNFTATTRNNATFTWDFADGTLVTTIDSVTSHTYLAAGDYTPKLILTDVGGCSIPIAGTEVIKVTGVTAGFLMGPSSFCEEGTVQFTNTTVSNDFITAYQWNFGDGSTSSDQHPAHQYSQPGLYTVSLTVTTQNGCVDSLRYSDTVKLYANPVIAIQGDSSGCAPVALSLKGSVPSGDSSQLSWLWNFGNNATDSAQFPAPVIYSQAGNYSVTASVVDNHGCGASASKNITLYSTPLVQIIGDSIACTPALLQFGGLLTSGASPDVQWSWNMGNGQTSTLETPPVQSYPAGTYQITVQTVNNKGCTDTATKTIRVYETPVVEMLGDSSSCSPLLLNLSGRIVLGDTTGLTWSWDLGNGTTYAVQTPPAQTFTTGTYPVRLSVANQYGCSTSSTRTVNAYAIPTVNAGADRFICRGSFTPLTATGALTYTWNQSPSLSCTSCASPLAAPTDSSVYIVTGITQYGCINRDTIAIGVHQPFTLQVGAGDTICAGERVNLRAYGADQYTWIPALGVATPGNAITTAQPAASTQYRVVAKDNFNCFVDTGFVYIKVWPIPSVNAGTDKVVPVGTMVPLRPAYSADVTRYLWSNPQTLSCATCPNPDVQTRGERTTYRVQVTNDGGCAASDEVTINTICNGGNLFIPNTFSPNADGKNERFYARGTGLSQIKSFRVYNRWGELVFAVTNINANDASAGWDGRYKGQALSPDVYVYTCEVVCANNEVLTYNGNVTLLR